MSSSPPPDLAIGGDLLWSSGRSPPPLTWFDDTPIPAWLEVHAFDMDAGSIVVEWPYEGGTWVDFAYTGHEFGTETRPFNTFTEGVNAAAYRGTLELKGGLGHETGGFTKRLRVETVGSPSTISGNSEDP